VQTDRFLGKSQEKHPRFLNPAEAAAYLGGLNVRTVVKWAREGYLPAYPIGEGKRRLWRFLEADLEHWMLSRRTGTLGPAADAPTGGYAQ
jgi:excisionase family DNA binding protein